MKNKLIKPDWFPLTVYNETHKATGWLDNIATRVELIRQIHNQPITQEIAKKIFIETIIENKRKSILGELISSHHQPISPISVFDILYIARLISNSEWFKNHENRINIEKIIDDLVNGKNLTEDQRLILQEFKQQPWHAFQKEGETTWFKYMSDTPMTVDFSFEYKSLQSCLQKFRNDYLSQNNINKKIRSIPDIFPEWQQKQILAIFDLLVWYSINEVDLQNHRGELVSIIWPTLPSSNKTKQPFNPIELLDIATEVSTKAIDPATVRALIVYCENEIHHKEQYSLEA